MKHKPTVIIIDGNNMLFRAYYKFKTLKSISGTNTGITFGFTYILKGILTRFKPNNLYVVFDGGRSKHRMDIIGDYKHRIRKPDFDAKDFYRQKDVTKEILKCLCVKVIEKPKTEADDIIWLLTRKLKRKNKVIIVSSDKDFNQCLSKDVSIWSPHKLLLITPKNVKKLFGYTEKQCVDYLILDGDKSDNIKGMPGVGPKTAIKFLTEFGSIYNFLNNPENKFKKWDRGKLEQVYLDNRELIDLRLYVRKYMDNSYLEVLHKDLKEIDIEELAYISADNSIRSFIKKPFIKEFKNLLK